MTIPILYADKHMVVAVKPRGVLSQSDEKNSPSILSYLEEELSGSVFPVHRLDRETQGVMVFARSPKAAASISRAIAENLFAKEYFAILTSTPEEEGTLEDLLFFDRARGKVFPVKRERKGVKKARLHYKLEKNCDNLSLVRVFPETGRTHQIRVQFASRKMPLYGDKKYGGCGEGLGLFCHKLSFPHPATGESVSFSALPDDQAPWNLFFPL